MNTTATILNNQQIADTSTMKWTKRRHPDVPNVDMDLIINHDEMVLRLHAFLNQKGNFAFTVNRYFVVFRFVDDSTGECQYLFNCSNYENGKEFLTTVRYTIDKHGNLNKESTDPEHLFGITANNQLYSAAKINIETLAKSAQAIEMLKDNPSVAMPDLNQTSGEETRKEPTSHNTVPVYLSENFTSITNLDAIVTDIYSSSDVVMSATKVFIYNGLLVVRDVITPPAPGVATDVLHLFQRVFTNAEETTISHFMAVGPTQLVRLYDIKTTFDKLLSNILKQNKQ